MNAAGVEARRPAEAASPPLPQKSSTGAARSARAAGVLALSFQE